jgi:hypothetical protein
VASNRIFSLQLAGHDGDFGPREKPAGWRKYISRVALIPAAFLIFFPSFRLGYMAIQAPSFTIPDSVNEGSVFTLPSDLSLASVHVSGRAPTMISKPSGLYLIAASKEGEMELTLIFRDTEKKPMFKRPFKARFQHPIAFIYTKSIHVVGNPAASSSAPGTNSSRAPANAAPMAALPIERVDGLVNASCWKSPEVKELDPSLQPVHRGHRSRLIRLATMSNGGPGEVVQTASMTPGSPEKSVLIYHGGGLYSRYSDLKELRVRKGDKIQAGQVLGIINKVSTTGARKSLNGAPWSLYLSKTELNPEGFLELSSQLCGSM